MALEIQEAVQNGWRRLFPNEEELVQKALDEYLTEYGKILLMGLHTVMFG